LLNLAGIILAALGRFPYAEKHLGALVLGNLLMAILMRNELFLRFLYLISIYGLRSVRLPDSVMFPYSPPTINRDQLTISLSGKTVGTTLAQTRSNFHPAARGRNS